MAKSYNVGVAYRKSQSNIPVVLKTGETFKNVSEFRNVYPLENNQSNGLVESLIGLACFLIIGKIFK